MPAQTGDTVHTPEPKHPSLRRRWIRSGWIRIGWIRIGAWVASIVLVAGAATAGVILAEPASKPVVQAAMVASLTPTPSPTPTTPPAPAQPSQAVLTALPLAFYDAVIPALLDSTTVTPMNQWQIATPINPLTALYASPSAAAPIASLGSIVPTVKTPTAVAVYGVSGEMILISTPSRRAVPTGDTPAQRRPSPGPAGPISQSRQRCCP